MKRAFPSVWVCFFLIALVSVSAQQADPVPPTRLAAAPAAATLATDAERTSLTYSSYNFEVHLDPERHSLAVHAHLVARNDSDLPLRQLVLQLSSSLHWYSIHVNGSAVKFKTESLASDIDHTGQLTEAVVPLARPLAPGDSVRLDVIYSGEIQGSSERLLRLGAPDKIAATSEWDRIGPDFTALRGFGNVIWFPVSTAPVLLGQGPRMFESVGKWKRRESTAKITMRVQVEYVNRKPTVAFLNGSVVRPDSSTPGKAESPNRVKTSAIGKGIPAVVSFTLPQTALGFSPLSFFVAGTSLKHFPGLDIYVQPGNESAAEAYAKIVANDRPQVEHWLGTHPKRPVVLVGLPKSTDIPFEDDNLLFLPLQPNPASDSTGPVLAHMLGHSYFVSARPWLNEGVAQLMTMLWIEHRAGRGVAIAQMQSHRAALALAETGDPGVSPGQSLIQAWSDIYYRDKAANVLWMLRDIVEATPFAQALQNYKTNVDREPSYFQTLLQKTSGKDLEWFFDDWVYRDRGLPDLEIASAYGRPILTKNSSKMNYLVSVDVKNDGFCSAEIPVTVESASTIQTKRLLVPSHSRAALRMLMDSKPTQVIVNDGSVPEVQTSRHERAIEATE